MELVRVLWRSVALVLTTVIHHAVILPFYVLVPFGFDVKGIAAFLRHRWGISVCRILNTTVTIHGSVPSPPFFLVSNHLSYADVWVLFSALRGTFIAKREVRDWPFLGWVIATSGILFIDRTRRMDVKRANNEITRSISDTQGIILFPEGTTSAGDDVLPFRSPLLHYPASRPMPVHTVAIRYQSRDEGYTAREHICWWDDTPFSAHLFRLLRLKGMHADLYFHEETVQSNDRKELAMLAEEQVRDLHLTSVQLKEAQAV